jgi:8-oxo-dGTP pyrophosphatase MutT (NUDIX family)
MTEPKNPVQIGPWRVLSAQVAFDNPWISVVDHKVTHPNGASGEYGVVRFKNRAVGILPIDEEGRTILVGQHRFPLDRYSWELPEGGAPLREDPLKAARRELAEETGLTAKTWLPLAEMDLSNSVTDEAAVSFIACDLKEGAAAPEASEALTVRKIPFAALLDEILAGKIRDSLTVLMALSAHFRALKGRLPERISRLLLK